MSGVLTVENVFDKVKNIETTLNDIFTGKLTELPCKPSRDTVVLPLHELPQKPGLSLKKGQGRLVHDLANIELQAMELCIRTLIEFPEACAEFKKELADLCISESTHLLACLEAIKKLDCSWGEWPVHMALWDCVSSEDSLLDRILIVHRYLEGSGLDASNGILRKLNGVDNSISRPVVQLIATEEVEHVQFGNRWYKKICEEQKINPEDDFKQRFSALAYRLPRRLEKINRELRLKSGFTLSEIEVLEYHRSHNLS